MGAAVDEKTLGKKLQAARKKAGLTQQELCQKAGLSYSTLAKIERGAIASPSVFTVVAIAQATGVELEALLDIKNSLSSPAPPDSKKTSKNGVRFVYFDIGGTLLHAYYRAFSKIAGDHGMSVDVVENCYWRHNDAIWRGQIDMAHFNNLVGGELGVSGFNWVDYYLGSVEPIAGSAELLKWVAEHYGVGLLSNTMPGMIDELKSHHLLPDIDYKAVVDSSQVGAVKPEPKIYEYALQKAGVSAKEILLIDNERPNLTGADRAGWQVLWFNDLDPTESVARVKEQLAF